MVKIFFADYICWCKKLIKTTRNKRSDGSSYLKSLYKTYLQNLRSKGACIFHLILVGIFYLSIMKVVCQQSISKKFDESFLSMLPKPLSIRLELDEIIVSDLSKIRVVFWDYFAQPARDADRLWESFCEIVLPCLGCYQLIIQFASAARPNLELENPIFLVRKNEVSTTADMWLQRRIDFFHATLL